MAVETQAELEQVYAWRLGRLLVLGFNFRQARVLADLEEVDLHHVEALLARGCEPALAFKILR